MKRHLESQDHVGNGDSFNEKDWTHCVMQNKILYRAKCQECSALNRLVLLNIALSLGLYNVDYMSHADLCKTIASHISVLLGTVDQIYIDEENINDKGRKGERRHRGSEEEEEPLQFEATTKRMKARADLLPRNYGQVRLLIHMPHGENIRAAFSAKDEIGDVYRLIDEYERESGNNYLGDYVLRMVPIPGASTYDSLVLDRNDESTLRELGIKGGRLIVETL